jgi:hypothetical protein
MTAMYRYTCWYAKKVPKKKIFGIIISEEMDVLYGGLKAFLEFESPL